MKSYSREVSCYEVLYIVCLNTQYLLEFKMRAVSLKTFALVAEVSKAGL